jgi:hypothetical protein
MFTQKTRAYSLDRVAKGFLTFSQSLLWEQTMGKESTFHAWHLKLKEIRIKTLSLCSPFQSAFHTRCWQHRIVTALSTLFPHSSFSATDLLANMDMDKSNPLREAVDMMLLSTLSSWMPVRALLLENVMWQWTVLFRCCSTETRQHVQCVKYAQSYFPLLSLVKIWSSSISLLFQCDILECDHVHKRISTGVPDASEGRRCCTVCTFFPGPRMRETRGERLCDTGTGGVHAGMKGQKAGQNI